MADKVAFVIIQITVIITANRGNIIDGLIIESVLPNA
jgi:hypothetical protein